MIMANIRRYYSQKKTMDFFKKALRMASCKHIKVVLQHSFFVSGPTLQARGDLFSFG